MFLSVINRQQISYNNFCFRKEKDQVLIQVQLNNVFFSRSVVGQISSLGQKSMVFFNIFFQNIAGHECIPLLKAYNELLDLIIDEFS